MGGLGSGNRYRWQERKLTVEESLAVTIADVRGRILSGASGTLHWTNSRSDDKYSVGYLVTCGDVPTITLHYRWRESEDVRIAVRLQTTPTQFGGERWWFTCPLITGDMACNRRIGKLYLPPSAKYFGCRKCHALSYRSCQEAHQTERLFASMERIGKFEGRLAAMASRKR
jgi:hypothetical protein